jgi:anti-sigma factor RsiW
MTANNECDNLDAFLSDELGAGAAARFEAHLTACDACREAIDEQRWIDALLRSSATLQDERVPNTVLESFRTRVARRRRRVTLAAFGVAAAAMVVVAAGWTLLLSRQAMVPAGLEVATSDVLSHDVPPAQPPRAAFVGGDNMIVVSVKSRHPDVTIVRVYPTYQSSYAAHSSAADSSFGDDFTWPFSSNGG